MEGSWDAGMVGYEVNWGRWYRSIWLGI